MRQLEKTKIACRNDKNLLSALGFRAFPFQDSNVRVFSLVTEKYACIFALILIRKFDICDISEIRTMIIVRDSQMFEIVEFDISKVI